MNKQTISFKQIALCTVIACNLMLIALLYAKHQYNLPELSEPVVSQPASSQEANRYSLEFVSSSRNGSWRIEHYREVEYRFDNQGRVLQRRPTGKVEHLRYYDPR